MRNKDASASLKEAISLLEIKQAEELRLLKDQFFVAYEKLKPINLVKSTLNELSSSSGIRNRLINSMIGILSGYLMQKFILGSKPGLIKKLAGVLLRVGVKAIVSKYAETAKTICLQLMAQFLNTNKIEDIKPVSGDA